MKAILLILSILTLHLGFACDCITLRDLTEEVKYVDYVFVGRVISADTLMVVDSNQIKSPPDIRVMNELSRAVIGVAHYKIEVCENYKGIITSLILDIYSAPDDETCGFQFQIGSEYIVYGSKEVLMYFDDSGDYYPPKGDNIIWVSRCSRTRLKTVKEIKELEKI